MVIFILLLFELGGFCCAVDSPIFSYIFTILDDYSPILSRLNTHLIIDIRLILLALWFAPILLNLYIYFFFLSTCQFTVSLYDSIHEYIV